MSLYGFAQPRRATLVALGAEREWFGRAGQTLVTLMIFGAVSLIFLVSDMQLSNLGFTYAEVGGSPLEKVHPGTWLAILALFAIGVGLGNPLRLAEVIFAYRGLTVFLIYWLALLAYTLAVTKAPFTPLIDTFFLPIVVVLLLGWASERLKRNLAVFLHMVMAADAILGIYEYVSGARLVPYLIAGVEITTDWRSTALFGHPLGNALLIGAYIVTLGFGGGRDLPRLVRPMLLMLCLVSMAAFGGRSSLVIALALLGAKAIVRTIAVLRGARFDLPTTAFIVLLTPLVAGAVYALGSGGFFDQFIERFSSDNGSAKARLLILNLYQSLSWQDLLLGPDQSYLASLQALEGIEFGIESFWIGFMMTHGILMSVFFFVALGFFCWQLVRETRPASGVVLLFYFVVASTAVSLSAKTTAFGLFCAMLLVMMRPQNTVAALHPSSLALR